MSSTAGLQFHPDASACHPLLFFFLLSIICRFLFPLFLLPYSLPWKSLFKLQKVFRPFLNKLIFNSFSSFRLRAGFDASMMERFSFSFSIIISNADLDRAKKNKEKNVFFGKWIRHRLHFAYMAVALWISIAFRREVVWTWTRFRNLLLFPFFCAIIRKNLRRELDRNKKKKGKKGMTIV